VTKDEAFEKLVETVEKTSAGTFTKDEDAFLVAAQALNYIMDRIDGSTGQDTD